MWSRAERGRVWVGIEGAGWAQRRPAPCPLSPARHAHARHVPRSMASSRSFPASASASAAVHFLSFLRLRCGPWLLPRRVTGPVWQCGGVAVWRCGCMTGVGVAVYDSRVVCGSVRGCGSAWRGCGHCWVRRHTVQCRAPAVSRWVGSLLPLPMPPGLAQPRPAPETWRGCLTLLRPRGSTERDGAAGGAGGGHSGYSYHSRSAAGPGVGAAAGD